MRRELIQAYRDEETFWKLKSRNQWLNDGDRNTRFFHAVTKNRIARNHLTTSLNSHGVKIRGNSDISKEAIRYFGELFSSTDYNPTTVLHNIQTTVTEEMNGVLTRHITEAKIKQALFSIGATRAPGPDGFNAAFYQRYWHIVGPAITAEVQSFFVSGKMPDNWNHINLCLIPKIMSPQTMKGFRPISLCNVTYKIISKVLSVRLKSILSNVISENQAAFTPDRFITDNVLIAHEVLHYLRVRKRCANSYMAVKTDISKAYDRIEWSFLEGVLRKKGFASQWIRWIMECVRSVSFSVLINGSPYGNFDATRGLRQGDPLSPQLFILCADVLSSMITQATTEKKINGIHISNGGPPVSHLLFADDSLFFLKADYKNSSNLLAIFKEYEAASGQMINLDKSAITFGNRVYQHTRNNIMNTLNIPNIGGRGKYLGLPEQFGRKKKEMLQYIQERVQQKIEGWQTRFLSEAGKETLIKVVAYAMPVYSMNCFKIPIELCSEIDKMIARFWWGSTKDKQKLSWIAWRKLTIPKKVGGLGFRDLHLFNQALLANQVWKILKRPHSLIYRLFKARYFRDGSLFSATRGAQPSYAWNSMRFGRDLLQQRIQFSIRDGQSTIMGLDPWLPTTPPRPPKLSSTAYSELKVTSLIDQQSNQWDDTKIQLMIDPEDHHLIYKIYLPQNPKPDSYIWSPTHDGRYTVKSGYWTAVNLEVEQTTVIPPLANFPDIATAVWKLDITPKLKHFLWRFASRSLGIAENLRRRNINVDPYCSRCCAELETNDHTLFSCPQVEMMWRAVGIPTSQLCDQSISLEDKLRLLFQLHNDTQIDETIRFVPFWLMWRIWESRNDLVFNRKRTESLDTVAYALTDTKEWMDNIAPREARQRNAAPVSKRATKWSPPTSDWLKCNYDASHHPGNTVSGLGWLFRNSNGTVLECGMGQFQGRMTAEEAECSALIWAIQAANAYGYTKVIFEGDNININRLINQKSPHPRLQHYLDTIHSWIPTFTSVKFIFKHREQNACADLLAKKAISSDSHWSLFHS